MDGDGKLGESAKRLSRALALALVAAPMLAAAGPSNVAPQLKSAATSAPPIAAAPAPAWQEAARRDFLRGYQAERGGDYQQAAQVFGALIGRYPNLGDYVLFYLGRAQSELGSSSAAEANFAELLRNYPQSILANQSEFELGKLALKQEQFARAEQIAARLASRVGPGALEAQTRVLWASALAGQRDIRGASNQLDLARFKFPRSSADARARALQDALRKLYPDLIGLHTAAEFRGEAELLLKEGLAAQALAAVESARALNPDAQMLVQLLWIEARAAAHVDRARQKRALERYLDLAPDGAAAAHAAYALALWYWRADQTEQARDWFAGVARDFPASPLAAEAMLRAARIAEEDNDFSRARVEYLRLAARYPQSDAGEQARFRAPWMLYRSGDFSAAAETFGKLRERTPAGAARDRFGYWEARALEKLGRHAMARAQFVQVAQSLESNYYPALAARKTAERAPVPPAAAAADLADSGSPRADGAAQFHLVRVEEFAAMGLKRLMPDELMALNRLAGERQNLRDFVLAKLKDADDYYDAIVVAIEMEQRGELRSAAAERARYPRAYWSWIVAISAQARLEPYLMLAVARQESLFNPRALSASGARGLMQLLPATAGRLGGAGPGQIDLYDPRRNLELGAQELRRLLDRFEGDLFRAVAAYNAGEQAVDRWNAAFAGDDDEWAENIEYKETRLYVKKVLGGLREYRMLYAPAARGFALDEAGARPARANHGGADPGNDRP